MKTYSFNLTHALFVLACAFLIPFADAAAAVPNCPFTASNGAIVVEFPQSGAEPMTGKNRLVAYSWASHWPKHVDTAATIPAGEYTVSLYAYDSYAGRSSRYAQTKEQYHLQFFNGNTRIAASQSTPDLRDDKDTATWRGVVNTTLNLSQDVTTVRAAHTYPTNQPSSSHSVNAGCALLEPVIQCVGDPYIAEVLAWSSCSGGLQIATNVRYETPTDCRDYDDVPTVRSCVTQCSDGIDNDGDGTTDYPNDAGCTNADDDDESDDVPACRDGLDNDGDGAVDYPDDPGCSSRNDDTEDSENTNPPTVTLEVARDGGTGTFGARSGDDIDNLGSTEQIRLYWDSTNTASCSKTFVAGAAVDGVANSVTEPEHGATINYVVSCIGVHGARVSDTLSVTKPPSGPTISANDNSVHVGDTVTIEWNTSGADPASCTVTETSNSGLSAAYASGLSVGSGVEVLTINEDTVYTITCPVGAADTKVFALPKVYES
ncbi:MAG: hypothetical protein LR017_03950 [Candidatus Pacebacteria bacterium]|nr:hypothetical protein [Candidatus Paceibacterota bacterium]